MSVNHASKVAAFRARWHEWKRVLFHRCTSLLFLDYQAFGLSSQSGSATILSDVSNQASRSIPAYFSQWPFSCITNSGETTRKARVLRLKRVEAAASRFVVVLMCVSPFVYSCYAFTGPKRGRPAPTITTPPFTRVRVRVFYPAMSGARFDGR